MKQSVFVPRFRVAWCVRTTRSGRLALLAATTAATLLGAAGVAQAAEVNFARNALVRSLTLPCTLGSGPENAVDGASSNIYTDKWCTVASRPRIIITLPLSARSATINRVVVKHAGAGGESTALNTKSFYMNAYQILGGLGLVHSRTIAQVFANTASVTTHPVNLTSVFEIVLDVFVPTQNGNPATRIYEVEVWGTPPM